MKTIKTIAREEEVITCDYCGEVVLYPDTCFQCGKQACNECCWKMVEYKASAPGTLDLSEHRHGTGIRLPEINFCADCDKVSPLAKVLKEIAELNAGIIDTFAEYRRNHHRLADRADRLIEKGQQV